ncbi:MAG: hypothetical protein R3C40_07705 [Parvularculaceae bacterium]
MVSCRMHMLKRRGRRAVLHRQAFYRSVRSGARYGDGGAELISGRDCAALDIGCSDGTLLSFYPRWVDRYGVDTLDDVDQIGSWAWSAKAAFPSMI